MATAGIDMRVGEIVIELKQREKWQTHKPIWMPLKCGSIDLLVKPVRPLSRWSLFLSTMHRFCHVTGSEELSLSILHRSGFQIHWAFMGFLKTLQVFPEK